MCHTVRVNWDEGPLERGARHAPRRASDVVTRAIGGSERRSDDVLAANWITRASIFQNGVPQVELGQTEAGLFGVQLESSSNVSISDRQKQWPCRMAPLAELFRGLDGGESPAADFPRCLARLEKQ